jgi:predicted DNA-binding transcriptional regulator AlpA
MSAKALNQMYVTTKDIAEALGVTRAYVTDKLTKRPDFPKPAVDLSQRLRRWNRRDFEYWLRASRQCPRRSPDSTYSTAA